MNKRTIAILMAAVMVLALLAGCGGSSSSSGGSEASSGSAASSASSSGAAAAERKTKDTLTVAIIEDMMSMDPQETNRASNWAIQRQIYNHLVHENPDGSVDPELATKWEWEDDLTLRMWLRDDVYFHNGVQFTAKDVYFMIEKALATSLSASTYASFDIENTEIVNDFEIVLKFKQPYAPVFNTLTSGRGSVPCKEYFDEVGPEVAAREPVGTGPYKFVSWDAGTQMVLEANENYWDTANMAKTKNVILKVVGNTSSRVVELETQSSDLVFEIATTDIDRVNAIEGAHADVSESNRYMLVTFSMKDETLSNKDLRYALSYAIDRQAIINVEYGGNALMATGMYPHNVFAFREIPDYMPYDLAKAKEYMAKAGYPDGGLKLLFNVEDREVDRRIAVMLQDMWKQIGVETEIIVAGDSAYVSQGYSYQIGLRAGNANEPSNILIIYDSAFAQKIQGCDDHIDSELARCKTLLDASERAEAYGALQEYLYDIRFTVPLLETPVVFGVSDNVEGFVSDPLQQINLNSIVVYE
ncbi:MAG: ABC transporter substrate-binding protein [Oscillospiraceae bacterium]|nr:ABC transporter substrate-binding protein [Oscillospiraceae bacterium]